ncbi:MAG: ATP-binding cassette domain-containing protein [Chitinivibrionales bacterium]|nr:ATP-binding cassette domain-containing protein [Chitinivibrionales bacterium]
MHNNQATVLSVKNLSVSFEVDEGISPAVRDISFDIHPRRSLGIVGESGCGKSVTSLAAMRLIPQPPGKIETGEIYLNGKDLLSLSESEMRSVRGREISMIFQDPMTSLNPVFTCGSQISEAIMLHRKLPPAEAHQATIEILEKVGIPHPPAAAENYPHQMSGGMRQRVMIAMALSCKPKLLIADEPTTALDVTVQARILDLLLHLQQEMNMSMIMISHDLGIVCDVAHEILVMYAGEMVEYAPADQLFSSPLHPYTQSLLKTIPYIDRKENSLKVIKGEVPSPLSIPPGCPFHPRCDHVMERCKHEHPPLYTPSENQRVRCFLHDK